MGGIINGVTLSGLTRCYGGTFLVFADYMRPPVRLAALMGIGSLFVWSHDSIGVGEDGPTHQPIEHLASLRVIPGFDVVRPADANETAVAWRTMLERHDHPSGIILSRQDLPTLDRNNGFASADLVAKGGYVLRDTGSQPAVILIATGSEVGLAVAAQDALMAEGISSRVVSMPCQEWFDEQPEDYRKSVLPPEIDARVSIEAGVASGWQKYTGSRGRNVSIEHFGASASGGVCFEQFGFTVENVVAAVKESMA